ncbi:unnamed protein product [Boreogadus saida]
MSRIIVGLLFTPCNMTFKTSILLPRIRILSSAGRLSGNRLDFMHVKNILSTAGFRPKRPLTLLFGSVRRNVSAECNWGSQMFAKQSSTATRWNKLSTTTTLQKDGFTRSRERGVLLRKVVLGALGFATTAAVCVHTSARVTMAEGTESLKVNLESAEADWKETKDRMLSLPLDERRRFYRTRCYTSLDQVPVWSPSPGPSSEHQWCPRNKKLDGRISLHTGDITQLEVDAIVNAGEDTPRRCEALARGAPTPLPAWQPFYQRPSIQEPQRKDQQFESLFKAKRTSCPLLIIQEWRRSNSSSTVNCSTVTYSTVSYGTSIQRAM